MMNDEESGQINFSLFNKMEWLSLKKSSGSTRKSSRSSRKSSGSMRKSSGSWKNLPERQPTSTKYEKRWNDE